MQSKLRNASIWAFSALFGCISLFGSGWHSFVGHEFHRCASNHDPSRHDHEPATPDHASDHERECDSHGEHAHGGVQGEARNYDQDADPHDCPICGHFDLVQHLLLSPPLAATCLTVEVARFSAVSASLQAPGAYLSRGPPSCSAVR